MKAKHPTVRFGANPCDFHSREGLADCDGGTLQAQPMRPARHVDLARLNPGRHPIHNLRVLQNSENDGALWKLSNVNVLDLTIEDLTIEPDKENTTARASLLN